MSRHGSGRAHLGPAATAPKPPSKRSSTSRSGAAIGRFAHQADVPPLVKNQAWVRSPVDAFLLAKLEAKGLTPAAADKRRCIRRVTFDLIGLPPTPEEIDAFLNDHSPNAFAKVVDALLASPHYGERWARHWLDLVRYAETLGHEFDFEIPEAWRYRDYVIRAFNADVPYDQFVTEHMAGDLLPSRAAIRGRDSTNRSSAPAFGFWARQSIRRWMSAPTRPTASTTRSTCSAKRFSA